MSSNISCSYSSQNQGECMPSFIIMVKGESPDGQHWVHTLDHKDGFTLGCMGCQGHAERQKLQRLRV